MKGYVDLFIIPVRKKDLKAYGSMARRYGKIARDNGALEYREFIAESIKPEWAPPISSKVKIKQGEVMVFAIAGFRSKAHRDVVNKKVMRDPRMKVLMALKPPFDMKRMLFEGFSTLLQA